MPPETPPEPQLDAAEPRARRAPLVAADARAKQKSPHCPSRPGRPTTNWVALWLHGKSPNTIRAYGEDVAAFRAFTGTGLRSTYLWDLQRYADALTRALATRSRRLSAIAV